MTVKTEKAINSSLTKTSIRPVSYVQEALWEGAGREHKLATHTSSDAKLQASYMGGRLV